MKKFIVLIFRCIYHLLYHQFAWSYDYVAALVSLGRWNTWVGYTIPFLSEQRILEIGFGPGHLLLSAMRNNLHIIGLDESQQMIRRTSRMIKSYGYSPPITRGNAEFLPFLNNIFDQVVCTFPSEYIFNPQVISEIYRVLSPEGQLIILPFAWIKGKLWYEKIANRFIDIGTASKILDERLHPILKRIGFEISMTEIKDDKSNLLFMIATKPKEVSDRMEL